MTALEGAVLDGADLRDASLDAAQLQGASFNAAQLQGASLGSTHLQGASLNNARLQGASLSYAELQGASLEDAKLQGATFYNATLEGASLSSAEIQGADFAEGTMTYVDFSGAYVWRANGLNCRTVNVNGHKPEAVVGQRFDMGDDPIRTTPDEVTKFIERAVAEIPDTSVRQPAVNRMRRGLLHPGAKDDTAEIAKAWSDCEELAKGKIDDEFQDGRAQLLRDLVCGAKDDREAIILGAVRNWLREDEVPRYFTGLLAYRLLTSDGRGCPAMKHLSKSTKDRLRATMVPEAIVPRAAPAPLPIAEVQ